MKLQLIKKLLFGKRFDIDKKLELNFIKEDNSFSSIIIGNENSILNVTEVDNHLLANSARKDSGQLEIDREEIHHEEPVVFVNRQYTPPQPKPSGNNDDDGLFDDAEDDMPDFDPTLELSRYKFPPIELLEERSTGNPQVSDDELIANKNKLFSTLKNFKIGAEIVNVVAGPSISLYEVVPAAGVRISNIKNLLDDLSLSMSAYGIRIIAPIPGKNTIGIEICHKIPEIVSIRSVIESKLFQESIFELPLALGKTITNESYVIDLSIVTNILVTGAIGQGKSACLNTIITSLLYKKHPSQIKFVLIDPKKVELNSYSIIEKHFLAKMPGEKEPIITDVHKVKNTLNSLNIEMDQRYDLLKKAHARNIKEYNEKFISRRLNPLKGHRYQPYLVVVIDEFADLILIAGKEVELPLARIAQLGHLIGIHIILATQRPSISVIAKQLSDSFPLRITFKFTSMIDSKFLNLPDVNQLISEGDMLISTGNNLTRVQCAFVDTPEVEAIAHYISQQPSFPTAYLLPEYLEDGATESETIDLKNRDELFDEAARIIVMNQQGSTSTIQRQFSIGYNRAGRIMDQLEAARIVGQYEGSKARQVLVQDKYVLEQLLKGISLL